MTDDWRRYHGVANLNECINPKALKLAINKPAAGVQIEIDQIRLRSQLDQTFDHSHLIQFENAIFSLTNFRRDRSWRKAAELRTMELRTLPVKVKVSDHRTKKVQVKMIKNAFPFGGTVNKDMMGSQYAIEMWPTLFNYG